jgi:hypothetical protein
LEDFNLKLVSLEKIKPTISEENYSTMLNNYQKQIGDLIPRIENKTFELSALKNEIELDSKLLEGEISLLDKELQETQFLLEKGALGKQDYDSKRSSLQQKINKNRNQISSNCIFLLKTDSSSC